MMQRCCCCRVLCWAEYSPNSAQWLENYVNPMDTKGLGPELQWIDSQRTNMRMRRVRLASAPRTM
ncbi:hypothetical protein BCC0191_000414 [Burkholderia ambifaria]